MLPGPTQVRGIATGATSRNGTRPEDRREVHAHRAGRLARVDGDQSERSQPGNLDLTTWHGNCQRSPQREFALGSKMDPTSDT
jgi:hypothetical protein